MLTKRRAIAGDNAPPISVRISEQVAEKGMYAVFLLLPLIFLPSVWWLFDIPKVTSLRVLTLVVLFAYLSCIVYSRQLRIVRPPVLLPVAGYLAIYSLSTIFSISPNLSLYGRDGRNFGLISLINMILLFFLVASIMTERKQLICCLKLFVATSTIVAILGILQFYEVGIPAISTMMAGRASSTFGNPDFLFSFLVLPIPLALGFLLKKRWFYLLPLSLLVSCLFLSMPSLSSRAPITDVSVPDEGKGSSTDVSVLDQISTYIERTAWSPASGRLSLIGIAAKTIPDHPVLGSGPNTFRDTFMQYATLEYTQENLDKRQDKVHNSFVEAMATTGILGLLAYVLVLIAIAWYFLRWLRRNRKEPDAVLVAMILVSAVMYIGQSLVIFHTVIPYTFFWLLMALGIGLCSAGHRQILTVRFKISNTVSYCLVLLLLGVACWGAYLSVRPLVANAHYLEANRITPNNSNDAALAAARYRQALDWNGSEKWYHLKYSVALIDQAAYLTDSADRQQKYNEAMRVMRMAIDKEPQNATLYYNRAMLRLNFEPVVTSEVMADLNKAIELYPYYFMAYRLLAAAESRLGHYEEAIDAGEMALSIVPNDILVMTNLGETYVVLERYDEAINLLQRAIAAHPESPDIHYSLGYAYEKTDRLDQARAQYAATLDLDPDHTEAADALARLGEG